MTAKATLIGATVWPPAAYSSGLLRPVYIATTADSQTLYDTPPTLSHCNLHCTTQLTCNSWSGSALASSQGLLATSSLLKAMLMEHQNMDSRVERSKSNCALPPTSRRIKRCHRVTRNDKCINTKCQDQQVLTCQANSSFCIADSSAERGAGSALACHRHARHG